MYDCIDATMKTLSNLSQDELVKMAFLEPVTQFYNWYWMRDKLNDFEKYGIEQFAFVHFDVKDFKSVNMIYGHDVADNLLRKICRNISVCDWVYFGCRCDNDNFAMMIEKMPDEVIMEKLNAFFANLSVLDVEDEYPLYFRCGVASVDNVADYRVMICDLAKMAKQKGNRANVTEIHFYTNDMQEEQIKSKKIKSDLPRAMANGEFLIYLQPKVDPKTNQVKGAEALARWNYHHEKILNPGAFVPYLEREGCIDVIDLFALEETCKVLEKWKQEGKQLIPISVNMSRTQLYNPCAIQNILAITSKYDVDYKYIEFELTESLAYDDVNYMIEIMKQLRELGFQLSIDDFGTGYSSLNLLTKMPLTTLKIDKSFVDEIDKKGDESSKKRHLVKTIIDMTKHLKINCVAEGVENQDQAALIAKWKCDNIQGFYYSKPIPINEFEQMLYEEAI